MTLAVLAFAHSGHAGVTVSCIINPASGQIEATSVWQNTLGVDRANGICSTKVSASALSGPAKSPETAKALTVISTVALPVQLKTVVAMSVDQAMPVSLPGKAEVSNETGGGRSATLSAARAQIRKYELAGALNTGAAGPDTTSAMPVITAAMSWPVGSSPTLRAVIEAWSLRAGIQVSWESSKDYPITDVVRTGQYSGTLKEALGQMAARFGTLPIPVGMKMINGGKELRVFDMPSTL